MAGLTRGYLICATPRSGSNLLCEALTSAGALGRPLEWFDQAAVTAAGVPDYPGEPEAQLAAIPRLAASPNGIYGIKVFAYQFERMCRTRWWATLPDLRFVWLRRGDLLGQAISLVRAQATQAWTSLDAPGEPPPYSAAAIEAALRAISEDDARWRRWFARLGFAPLELAYADVCGALQGTVERIAACLDVPGAPAIDHALIGLRPQRDALTAEWRERFIVERGAIGRFPA